MGRIDRMRRVIRHGKGRPCDMYAVMRRMECVRQLIYVASVILLGSFLVELVLLVTLGAVRSRAVVGPEFDVAQLTFFLLGTPALANVLVLRGRSPLVARWYFAAVICTIFSFFLVLLQYGVSEALYGPDGARRPQEPVLGLSSSRPSTSLSQGPGPFVEERQLLFVTEKDDLLAFDEYAISEIEELLDGFRAFHVGRQSERIAERIAGRATKDRVPVVLEPALKRSRAPRLRGLARHDRRSSSANDRRYRQD